MNKLINEKRISESVLLNMPIFFSMRLESVNIDQSDVALELPFSVSPG